MHLCVCGQLFLSCARCEWAIPLFSSPSRNQVNTPQSKMVIFPFKYGKCKHKKKKKNIYTSVKLLSQREYTITNRKALVPLHPKGSCINSIILIPDMRSPLLQRSFFILRDVYWKYSISYSSIHIEQLNYLNSQTNLLFKKKCNLVWF